ncbi:UvrD-helicase domain-containing protein [Modestobacter sp. VKM Ac-2979]|uniref:UvrD-helicase domain-containing protein n=1 Tax=unclassified Modestobacter TaxID=2643866 RepID=UPI0022ABA66F|nr:MULTISPECIES: UvrD-helicase domain-containing protein [unclassified Modestobacter]MCZ2813163.1 UvrD-helicase domain-containing protein [Modestobacter sp. VKM Ac-2979]MCZ2842808.1 UvrD-helicase domain-containing protein [Modestobacter sp. VKM Ac-2980]
MNAFDVCGPLPTGTTVLEASAGTGKTFAIAALTTRYVAEGAAELSEIMLVTFGNAASRELRDRVRERLVSAERGLRDPDAARRAERDPVLQLLADVPDDEVVRRQRRLARALAGFDEATIATTHSFCSQMLAGLGMAADADPTAAFVEDIDDLVREVVDDLYVRTFAGSADPPFLSHADLLDLGRRAVGSDRQATLWPLSDEGPAGRRRRAAAAVRREVEKRKRTVGLVDYDDWLSLLRDALTNDFSGTGACERVAGRYRVVMVDEFQDTDPVQWEILERAFHGRTTLVLIGDPKQAIYAFRGGDVTTYLAAAAEATTEATLGTNWRSDAPLLEALDLVFGGAALGHERIVVRPVNSAHPTARLTGAGAPLRLRRLERTGHGRTWQGMPSVARLRDAVAGDVAADVVDLLSGGAEYEGRTVQPGDLAVLARTNAQGHLLREALGRAGVPAVFAGGGSVFATPSATSWLRLLEALEQPHRAGRVRSAALSVFLGYDEESLDAGGNELADELGPQLRRWADVLAERGVAAFLEVLTAEKGLPARLLARPDGERLLTDLQHIGQVLHAAAQRESLGLTALVEWLRRRIAQSSVEGADERSRRLESDAAAVQLMTVHVSKGLEFPIVYVPFGWDRWTPDKPQVLRLHDDQGRRVLDVGGSSGPGYAAARARHEAEESGEDLRLLYVALTRARCQVIAHWAPSSNTAAAPLNRLLFGAAGLGAEPAARVQPPPDDGVAAALATLSARSGGRIEVADVARRAALRWEPLRTPVPELSISHFTRTLDEEWRRTSYSALTRDAHEQQLASEPDVAGTDDERDTEEPLPETPPADALPSPLTDLPGGAAFGTLVHAVLEDLDPDALDERCAEAVARHLVPGVTAQALADGLRPVLTTPLGDLGLPLASIAATDRLAELDFELPLAGGDDTVPHSTLADVAQLLRRHDLGPLSGYPDLMAALAPQALRGFLTGSIDAVLRLPGPVFAVVDYKTNRLGAEPLTTWHYRAEAMAEEMQRTHYVLQALLYCVALHRYLRWRLPGYDPDRHIGPVLYLFVRGMAGAAALAGAGVFTWTPPPGLVAELSDLLAGRP